jgi:sugar phosphate isomerase/epimerase
MKRREFIIKSSLLSVTAASMLQCTANKIAALGGGRVGLQLYTVRDAMSKDPKGTLQALAAMGYTDVENAGYNAGKYYGMEHKEFKMLLSDLGLRMLSGHTMTGNTNKEQKRTMVNDWEAACVDAANMGQKYLVLAYLVDSERKKIDDYKYVSELLNKCGETAKKHGIQMAYHNHDFEFKTLDGQIPYDLMMKETQKGLVSYELDVYWTAFAGVDTAKYYNTYKGRYDLMHVKDMSANSDKIFTEVGNGVIDWKPMFANAKAAGVDFFYVEQDRCVNHQPMESVKISIDYLKKNIVNS